MPVVAAWSEGWSAIMLWHADSRLDYSSPTEYQLVGAFDMPIVLNKWRFLGRALGFGYDVP